MTWRERGETLVGGWISGAGFALGVITVVALLLGIAELAEVVR